MKVAALVALLAGAVHAEAWQPPNATETGFFLLGEGLIAADMLQTFDIRYHKGGYELNPLLSSHPSDLRILLTGGAALALNAAGFWYLPPFLRRVLGGSVFFVESVNVAHNFGVGLSFRMPFQ